MTKISIIGSGFVGERVGRGLISLGHDVIFYDIADKEGLPNFTKEINYAIENSDVSFICVPTPTVNEKIDLNYIKEAAFCHRVPLSHRLREGKGDGDGNGEEGVKTPKVLNTVS